MHKLFELLIFSIVFVVLVYCYNMKYNHINTSQETENKENFRVDSQNFVYNNVNNIGNNLDYSGDDNMSGMYITGPRPIMGPSGREGVNQNSGSDVYDNRGYKWSGNAKDPEVDIITRNIDDSILRNKFERTYMLDPEGSVAKYDITNNNISPNCCPAQYAPPFKLTENDKTNCDYAQKYVANNYSGMNYNDGTGCVCMTPEQADFYGSRGGNTN